MKYLDDPLSRAVYSTDASNYRVVPDRVAVPENGGELRETILQALREGVSVTMRGRGTSCAGNAIGPGLVIDASRCREIVELDAVRRTAVVEPGVVIGTLQTAGKPHGLRFGPDPSTWTRATIGGVIGNNACGPHAQAWGRAADNVIELEVIDGCGREYRARSGRELVAEAAGVGLAGAGFAGVGLAGGGCDGLRDATVWDALNVVPGLRQLIENNLALIRSECGRFRRQVSGYSLEHLLPENGCDLPKFLAGSEGTLAAILRAKVRLVPVPTAPVLVVLGYDSMVDAARDVPLINSFNPLAVEGMDSRLVYTLRQKPGAGEIPALPDGEAWLLVEMGGDEDLEVTMARAREVATAVATAAVAVYPPGTDATRLWRIRADGAGLGGRTPLNEDGTGGDPAWPGWEDAAVPPEHLADYLAEFENLMRLFDVDGMMYGHLGDGCMHIRLNLPLGVAAGNLVNRAEQSGLENAPVAWTDGTAKSRAFLEAAADLVAKYKGSLSGEHGDGRARSELLPRMFSPEMVALFAQVKAIFDPNNLLNPGVLVAPDPLDAHLRLNGARELPSAPGGFDLDSERGLTAAVHRCTGVGKCLAMDQLEGAWMCPSYLATGDEKDATRGRARALQEVANGGLIRDFSDPALLEALDLCLACKACSSACPTGIDMARYRSETFYRAYTGRGLVTGKSEVHRPRSHYLLGRLPGWLRLVRTVPGGAAIGNTLFSVSWIRRAVFGLFGLETKRQMARFARVPFHRWARGRGLVKTSMPMSSPRPSETETVDISVRIAEQTSIYGSLPPNSVQKSQPDPTTETNPPEKWVALWADSFSEGIDPDGAQAVVELLERVGYRVFVPPEACCGLTYITTGQLDQARCRLERLCEILGPLAVNGIPIVGVEPSCTATLRDDLCRLLPADPRAAAIKDGVMTLAELLTHPRFGVISGQDTPADSALVTGNGNLVSPSWHLPDLTGVEVVAQPHCHHHSVLGWSADRALLQATGATLTELSGCCGMAGNFGMESGHFSVSKRVAEQSLLPALREHPEAVFLADGFSCRTQASQLAGRKGVHLARLLLDGREVLKR